MRGRGFVILCIAIVSVLASTLFTNVPVQGQSATIRIVPPSVEVTEGQDFGILVQIEDVVGMTAFQFKISWDPMYADFVSLTLCPPWPSPIIIGPTMGDSFIEVGAATINPEMAFSGTAVLAEITLHAVRSGTTYVQLSDVSILPGEPIVMPLVAISILPSSFTWVSVFGSISLYGTEAAQGFVRLFAIVDLWAGGWSAFTVPPLGPIIMIYPPPAFNFSLYVARIVNASAVKLNYEGNDLWVSGFWEVATLTNPRTMRDMQDFLHNSVGAYGEMNVTSGWTEFSINIQGCETIKGVVSYHHTRMVDASQDCQRYDLNEDFAVNMRDIAICCGAFGSTLGFERYELAADTNFDLMVNMRDIAECCSNFGKTY